MHKFKKYSKKDNYTYVFGAFPTLELLESRANDIIMVFIDQKYNDKEKLTNLLIEKNIAYEISSTTIRRIANKDNIYVVAVVNKIKNNILENKNHVLLHDISDMGNLGTIIRTMLGFGIKDLALIGNVCDIYNPKVIRASMGAIFKIRFEYFDSIEEYIKKFDNNLYLFMLSNNEEDSILNKKIKYPFSIVMGNEGAGLPQYFEKFGEKTFIPQSNEIDSFNLPIATSIGLYEFWRRL